jgi:hypothetical protein
MMNGGSSIRVGGRRSRAKLENVNYLCAAAWDDKRVGGYEREGIITRVGH